MGVLQTVLIIIAVVFVAAVVIAALGKNNDRGGAQPSTGAGPKPRQKLLNTRAARPRVRPTSRRMRTGGTACMLRRDEYATDLLFFIALDVALGYDEMHYGTVDFIDSPFLNDEFDYSGSDFEDYAETETELSAVVESDYMSSEEPEATSFEELDTTTEDDTTKYDSWGGDSGDNDFGGDSDFGGGDDW